MHAFKQTSKPGHYSFSVKLLSIVAFAWAFLAYLNENYFFLFNSPIWLNRYTEYVIILGFGLWRIISEKNPYTKKRLIVLVTCVTVLWLFIPWFFPFYEPYLGYSNNQPVFPSIHTPGTLTFFLVLISVILFGRRIVCGWNCPCVGIRETVGFPFRDKTLRNNRAWKLRHTKWIFFLLYSVAIYLTVSSAPNSWSVNYLGIFALLIIIPYFTTFFLSPVTGNRFYCRYLCPFGATFGLLNRVGFFQIDYNKSTCTECGLCEKVCDMGIPVYNLGKKFKKVDTADCMGCGRCVSECPTKSLAFHDIRNLFSNSLIQDRTRLRAFADIKNPVLVRQALIFTIAMIVLLTLSYMFFSNVGTEAELTNNLKELL